MVGILIKIARIWNSKFKYNYLKNKNLFLNFFFHWWNLHKYWNIFKERMIATANLFPKLQTVKNLVRPLSKKRRFRTHIDRQDVKASQILAKLPWERLYHVFSSFSGKVIWKMSPLVLCEILGESCNTLTADWKYFVQDCVNLPVRIQMQLSKNQKLFLNFFSHFLNLHQILNILQPTMITIATVFQKLQTVKNLLRSLSKKRRFRTRFNIQHVKASQILVKSPWEHFCHVSPSFSGNLIKNMSPPVLGDILVLFVNTLTSHAKYPVQDCDNLQLPLLMQLSQKRKIFSEFFVPFLESTSKLKYFKKKEDCHI